MTMNHTGQMWFSGWCSGYHDAVNTLWKLNNAAHEDNDHERARIIAELARELTTARRPLREKLRTELEAESEREARHYATQ